MIKKLALLTLMPISALAQDISTYWWQENLYHATGNPVVPGLVTYLNVSCEQFSPNLPEEVTGTIGFLSSYPDEAGFVVCLVDIEAHNPLTNTPERISFHVLDNKVPDLPNKPEGLTVE